MIGDDLKPLEDKLNTLVNLLAARCVENKNQEEGAFFLDKFGLDRKVIAKIYGTKPEAIRASISQAKKNSSKVRSSKKKQNS